MTYLLLFIVFLVGFYCGMTALALFVVAKRPEPKPLGLAELELP